MFGYASLEVLSFAILVLNWRKIRLATLHQLMFVLESQWRHIQVKVLVWVLFTIQLPLEHCGKCICVKSFIFLYAGITTAENSRTCSLLYNRSGLRVQVRMAPQQTALVTASTNDIDGFL